MREDKKQNEQWYAIYTKARAEKKVSKQLEDIRVTYYLPLQKVLRQWSDRKKWVEVPLFSSYIFVRFKPNDIRTYDTIRSVYGVSRFISFEGTPVTVPPYQIEVIRRFLKERDIPDQKALDHLTPGEPVAVQKGILTGLEGNIVEWKGKHKVLVNLESVAQKVLVTVPKSYLMPLDRIRQNKVIT